MNVARYGSINVGKPTTYTVPWGVAASPPEDPFRETEVRQAIADQTRVANSYIEYDNVSKGAYKDLDSQIGRVLIREEERVVPDLQGGVAQLAGSVRFDPSTKVLKSIDITSRDNNSSKHVVWKDGEFQSLQEERVLANGTREVVSMTVNSGSGTLTCTTQILAKAPESNA